VAARCAGDATLDVFHGITPWIATRPSRPFIAYSDCTFRDYIDIYHRRATFNAHDLIRIEEAEAAWVQKAEMLCFTSVWGANRAIEQYSLDPLRVTSIGIFGEMELPERDSFAGAQQFAFVAFDFVGKGGPKVASAFRKVRALYPKARLLIVSAMPEAPAEDGVEYIGPLRPVTTGVRVFRPGVSLFRKLSRITGRESSSTIRILLTM
jgi:hypothetical protein